MRRGVTITSGLASLVICLTAANMRREPGAVELDWRLVRPLAREVVVEPPSRGAIIQTVAAPGKVESVDEAEIGSQIVGRVVAVNVKKGDVVVRLDDTDARARLDSSQSRIERLRSAIDQAENDLAKANRDANLSGKLAG